MAGFGAVPKIPIIPGAGEMRSTLGSGGASSGASLGLMPNSADIRPIKNDLKWQPFRQKMRRQGNPFYTMGYSQGGK